MTEQQRAAFWHSLDNWGTYASRVSAILAMLVLVFGYIFWVRDWIRNQDEESAQLEKLVVSYSELSTTVQAQAMEIATLARNVDIATRPRVISEIDLDHSGPRTGTCVEFETCVIDVRMRRTLEGLPCDVIVGSDRYYFMDDVGNRVEVTKLSGTPLTNIQRDWFNYSWTFEVPGEMIEPVYFVYQFTYHHCRTPDDATEITVESEPVPVTVRAGEQVRRALSNPDFGPSVAPMTTPNGGD